MFTCATIQEGVERQREANEFLIVFAGSEVRCVYLFLSMIRYTYVCVYLACVLQAAWGVGLQLLLDTSLNLPPEALFFAANMIHTKVTILPLSRYTSIHRAAG